ncbi:MAG TPA: gliding motility-associated C-terminal domain-containing protein [Chitinophagaceae bacterium]|nr:gliding motility-associated C-terminal domain-containing protein [Chitinophagaceae bacterium]
MPNGEIYIGGIDGQNYIILKVDDKGDTVWTKEYSMAFRNYRYEAGLKTVIDYDGNLVSAAPGNTVLKTDTSGKILYSKEIVPDGGGIEYTIKDLYVLPNGDKAFLIYAGQFGWLVMVTDAELMNIKWSSLFNTTGFANTVSNAAITVNNGQVAFAAAINNYYNADSNKTALALFDEANGNILNQHYYRGLQSIQAIKPCGNGYFLTGNIVDSIDCYYARADARLNVLSASSLANTKYTHFMAYPANDGSFAAISSANIYQRQSFYDNFFLVDKDDHVTRAKGIFDFDGFFPTDIKATKNDIYVTEDLAADYANTGIPFIAPYFFKTDMFGDFSECVQTAPATVQIIPKKFSLSPSQGSFSRGNIMIILDTPAHYAGNVNFGFQSCTSTITCNAVNIIGKGVVCSDSAIYTGHKNPGCTAPVLWSVRKQDSAGVTIKYINDTTVQLKFLQRGNYQLMASINPGCTIFADTLLVLASGSLQKINLGTDTTLCNGNSLLLHAGSGFTQYSWQDGSTDSVYLITNPGQYYIQALDYCNDIFYDTIAVAFASPQNFTFTPKAFKCISDTLVLTGFSSYSNIVVTPFQNTNILNGSIGFYSRKTQSYNIAANDVHNCKVNGSITVSVYPQPVINLGSDTSICVGDSIILNAGTGFTSYSWSNGSNSPSTVINQAGKYNLIAITGNNCTVRDSFTLLQLYPLPVISLDTSSYLCYNTPKSLNAGDGFATYKWNNGSTGQALFVSDTGTYSVTVKDSNSCTNTDAVSIKTILPPPSRFLAGDTSLCNYQQLTLVASGSFKTYYWNTGGTQQTAVITAPGTYWLLATDDNNCSATDTIIVKQKECEEGFYIPNSFTPNNDGHNDIFRPLIFGNVTQFKFIVFNRWGEKVYETTTLQRGWDGTYKGHLQDIGAYVWYCTFQLNNQPLQLKKGTCVLMK